MPEVKDKERILTEGEKSINYLQGSSDKIVSWFLKRNFAEHKELAWNIQIDKKQRPITNITIPAKLLFRIKDR